VARRPTAVRFALAALLALTVTVVDAANARASLSAMACCAKAKGACAGVKRADDCCRGMGHTAAGPTSNTPQKHSMLDAPFLYAVVVWTTTSGDARSAFDPVFSPTFKRPHDPPHLHPFSLLI